MIFILLLLLICKAYVNVVKCDIVNSGLPDDLSICHVKNKTAQYECIQEKFSNSDWIADEGNEIHLRIREDFYWHPVKRIRRECRAFPKDEREAFFAAINALKQDTSLSPNVYDNFANMHTKRMIYSVHYGPNFPGWHRFFILKFEELLRKVNPNITLCYWQSSLDAIGGIARKSRMFTEDFMGNGNGKVINGPFANWKTILKKPLVRHFGNDGDLIYPYQIRNILKKQSHRQIVHPTADRGTNLEAIHNNVHSFIGGQMNNFETSSQEPFFWIHHPFIDSIWELFCTQLKNRTKHPQDDFVISKSKMHKPYDHMDRFFPLRQIDGYSEYFTKHIYEYEKYPACPECSNSPYLKCDAKHNRCQAIPVGKKLRKVENQQKWIETNHLSSPQHGISVMSNNGTMDDWVFVPIKIIYQNAINRNIRYTNITGCEYQDNSTGLCEQTVAIVQSNGITYRGSFKNYIVNDVGIPMWSYAFVGVRNPKLGTSQAFVSVTDKKGEPCLPYFLSDGDSKYKSFSGSISVTDADSKIYVNSVGQKELKDFAFDPLATDSLDERIKMLFRCY
ncbi:tyrosinase-like protein [Mytilus edulis]|uniref:tyrosinase-like protein n=1 Tax=Mytilus edulis TaxID=6550 RepID=UPI0039EF7109